MLMYMVYDFVCTHVLEHTHIVCMVFFFFKHTCHWIHTCSCRVCVFEYIHFTEYIHARCVYIIYTYVYVYIHIYMYMSFNTYMLMNIHLNIYIYIYIYIHIHTCYWIHACSCTLRVYLNMYIYIYIILNTYMLIYVVCVYIWMYTHVIDTYTFRYTRVGINALLQQILTCMFVCLDSCYICIEHSYARISTFVYTFTYLEKTRVGHILANCTGYFYISISISISIRMCPRPCV